MRELNSILLEGQVRTVHAHKGEPPFSIHLQNDGLQNPSEKEGPPGTVTVDISSMSPQIRLGLTKGRTVRIVGRLTVRHYGELVIAAEHIELKPEILKQKAS